MIKNYLKIAFRNLWKNKGYSAINIFGLAAGLAITLLIVLYVLDELSYDRFHEKADRIYRIDSDIRFGGSDLKLPVTPDPMGATLKKDYPQVEQFTRIYASEGSKLIKKGNDYITEVKIAYADSTFFDVFTFPIISGNPRTVLNDPNTAVISEAGAMKYFGTKDVIGKVLETNDNAAFKITAVMKDMPPNAHFHFDILLSMDNLDYQFGNYLSANFHTFILLQKGIDPVIFKRIFPEFIEKYILPQAQALMQIKSMDEFKKAGNNLEYSLIPLTKIHLHSNRFPELGTNGDIQNIYIFSAVALFILLIACINFMNLSTARSANRAREVGIRKVLGTERKSLVWQFMTESILVTYIALIIALGITLFMLPFFNDVASKNLKFSNLFNARFIPYLLLIPLVVGILAGSYPALFLSSFKPITVLKGNLSTGFKKSRLRSTLVIFQFATTIFLIFATIIVYTQLSYIQNRKIGFNKDQVLIIDNSDALGPKAESFKTEIMKLTGVSNGTLSSYLPVSNSSRSNTSYSTEAVFDMKNAINLQNWTIDADYLQTMGMEIKKGRNFSKEYGTDSSAIIINESSAAILGFEDPIGKNIYSLDNDAKQKKYTIIGVVNNFNFESLREEVGPLMFLYGRSTGSSIFKVNTKDLKPLLASIQSTWKNMAPGMPFSYRFLDESFDSMYRAEQRMGKLALAFAILAIIVACMGLFGLATYASEQRVKEIGIRKVLGASVSNITEMLSRDFLKLIVIAAVIAFPLAWWAMHQWLQNFAYRVGIQWWVFMVAASLALFIAVITISFQAIKAAVANPVKSLRTE